MEGRLAGLAHLDLVRVGDHLVAATRLGLPKRVLVAGHLDTVPANGNDRARLEGDWCWGLGAVDMKSGLAVMLELARTLTRPIHDVTFVFYSGEEVAARYNGLEHLYESHPHLLGCDAAVLCEPTGGHVEAGCQGTLRVRFTAVGSRAHTARGWMGRNAIHRLAPVLAAVAGEQRREVTIDGCRYREGLEAVQVEGGVAGNVVPDRAWLTVNHRFAPDRSPADAEARVRQLLTEAWARGWSGPGPDPDEPEVEVADLAPGAPPCLDHPLLAALIAATGAEPRAKLGWTDVSRFAARGVPATNFGPGDPNLAHHPEERVSRAELDRCLEVLRRVLGASVAG